MQKSRKQMCSDAIHFHDFKKCQTKIAADDILIFLSFKENKT